MKSLICITSSNRSLAIKSFIKPYVEFCQHNPSYDFLVALDGADAKSIKYCQSNSIPILYSQEREGVGLSKNRVLESFQNYDYYFFIEDDVELVNPEVFELHIAVANELGLQHMSLFPAERIGGIMEYIDSQQGGRVIAAQQGSAQVNFFTGSGLKQVGGFHTDFAKYRRFGHTEHSYRYVNSGLAKYPLYIIEKALTGYFEWNDPVSVTKVKVATVDRLFVGEVDLIDQKLAYFPLQTISKYCPPEAIDLSSSHIPASFCFFKAVFKLQMVALNMYRYAKKMIL